MHPIEIDAMLKLAKRKLREGKVPEAEAMYRKVLAVQPECGEAVHFLGMAAARRGKLEEAVGLVRKSIELEPEKAEYPNNLATVLGRMGRPIEALGAAQQALDLKPDQPEAWGNKGVALEALGRLDEAIDAYRKAMELKADHIDALANLGAALSRKGEHEEAITYLRKLADLRPRSGPARKSLGNALRRAGRAPEAVTAYRMAVELNPKDADSYNNLGAALQESGRFPEAEEALRQCLSIKPDHPDAHWNRGLALLSMGRWREGWMEYEWRQHLREDVGQKRNFPQPVWKGSPLEGRTVLVICEQGLGDTIQFIRYVPLLVARGAKVIVECQGRLKPLLLGLRRGEGATGGRGEEKDGSPSTRVVARGEPLPNFDFHARLLTLPGIFDSKPEGVPAEVPYLAVDAGRVERIGKVIERSVERTDGERIQIDGETGRNGDGERIQIDAETGGRGDGENEMLVTPSPAHPVAPSSSRPLRVGLVWQGNTAHKGDRFRSIPLAKFEPLARIDGVKLVSLQKGFGSEQIESCRDTAPLATWSDPADLTAEALLDTAAAMKNLYLIIAVDTSVAHLAGALGVPVWVAMPLACDWRWLLDREDTPWYPTMRLFRQRDLGDWDDVIARMAGALEGQIRARAMAADIASFSRTLQPMGDQALAMPEAACAGGM